MRPKHRLFAIGIILVVLTMICATQLQAQEEGQEVTLQEFMKQVFEIVLGMQDIVLDMQGSVKEIGEMAAEKSEVRALETRVTALETAMPWPTVTPTATPTPTPFPDEARNFALQLAVDDHAGLWGDFSDLSEDEQDRAVSIYLDYFVKTSNICELGFDETYEVIQKYAEPIDRYRPSALETRLRGMEMERAGWRLDFIARIATDYLSYGWISDKGCDRYLEWYTSG